MEFKQATTEAYIQSVRKYNRNITEKELLMLESAFLYGYNIGTMENKSVKHQKEIITKMKE